MQYEIKQLTNTQEIEKVLFMTYPIYQRAIRNDANKFILFAAFKDNQSIGLAVYTILKNDTVELTSIFTEKSHRNKSVARSIIKDSRIQLKKDAIKQIKIVYMDDKPYTKSLENMMNEFNFEDEIPRQSIIKLSIESFEEKAKFARKLIGIPEDFSLGLWKDVKEKDIKKLNQDNEKNKWIPEQLYPLNFVKNNCEQYSTAIYYKDELIGWMIMHLIAEDTIRFTCSYVKDEYQYLNFIIRVYQSIKEELIKNGINYISWTTPFVYKPMVNFNQKWMSKYCVYEGISKERNLYL